MALMNNYGERTTTIVKGDGPYLWDSEGRRYLDALSGIAVCGLGHNHPAVTDAICNQAKTLLHISNLYLTEPQMALGKALVEISGLDKVFFSNSGAEANEAAIKIARKYGNDKGITAPQIITTENSFHGRTMATLTATGNPKVKTGFTPLVEGFVHVPYNDVEAIKAAANENTVALMVEPIQGEGGIIVPDENYLSDLRQLCDEKGWLLILDEIQTGSGRSGKYFAYQHKGILPDIVTLAKGLANGSPIGACIAKGKAAEVLQPGTHGSTFGGNPVACAAGLATIEFTLKNNLLERAIALGDMIRTGVAKNFADSDKVVAIRGEGLLIGIELNKDCGELVEEAKKLGLLINVTAGKTIRLLPPLILTDEQAQDIVSIVSKLIENA